MNNLKTYRTNTGMTKKELAQKVNIHIDYISMIERNARTPSFKLAKRMADVFGITVDELFFCKLIE